MGRRVGRSLRVIAIAWTALAATRAAAGAVPEAHPKPAVALPTPIPLAAIERMPQDATAYCGDGTWSTAVSKSEACGRQGGVKTWFGPPPPGATGRCKDGTYTRAKKGTYGACSGYGGVKLWFSRPVPAAPAAN